MDRRDIEIIRTELVSSAFNELYPLERSEAIQGLTVNYEDEDGNDAGGLRAEFYTLITKELFDPRAGLFIETPNGGSLEINPYSNIVPNHLDLFEFAGLIIAKVSKFNFFMIY